MSTCFYSKVRLQTDAGGVIYLGFDIRSGNE